jgi:probable HAF family extracellular repeat protein
MAAMVTSSMCRIACAVALLLATGSARAAGLEFVGLGGLGGNAYAYAVNQAGQVAGYGASPSGATRALLWSGGGVTDLGTFGGSYGVGTGINAAGQVAGYAYYPGDSVVRAFVWTGGTMVDLGSLAGGMSIGTGINDAGQVTGYAVPASGGWHAFVTVNGGMVDLGTLGGLYSYGNGINASGQVTGYALTSSNAGYHAFLATPGGMVDLGTLGGSQSLGQGINAAGQVVGNAYLAGDSSYHAALWSGGRRIDLGTLGGSYSSASAINSGGQAVGWSHLAGNSAQHAVLFDGGNIFDLSLLAPAGWTLQDARGISDNLQIVGYGNHNGVNEAYKITLLDLKPAWLDGNGSWDSASRWQYGVLGPMQVPPSAGHDVEIHPAAASATVQGSADARVRSLTIGGDSGRIVTLDLAGGTTAASAGSRLQAQGVLTGNGRLDGPLVVEAGGRVWVRDGVSMQLGGAVDNAGKIDLQARSGAATLEVGGRLVNAAAGQLNLMNADLLAYGGVANSGRIALTGYSAISGRVDNAAAGQIVVAGVGGEALFWDDLHSDGVVSVASGASATFFGLVSGSGALAGEGLKVLVGGYSPGNSPALTTLSGAVEISGGVITLDIGGVGPGSQHDKVVFDGPVTIGQGVVLDLRWSDGYAGTPGAIYDLFDFNGGLTGRFASVTLPALTSDALTWSVGTLYVDGRVSINAVPEPAAGTLLLGGLVLGVVWLGRPLGYRRGERTS